MNRMGWVVAALIAVGGGLAACTDSFHESDTPPIPTDEAGVDDSGITQDTATISPVITVTLEGPTHVLVGESVDVNVLIQRNGDTPVVGPVHVDFGSTPDITLPAIDISADRSTGVAKITTAPTRKHGRIAFTAAATSSGPMPLQGKGVFDLLVRGPAGSVDNSFGSGGVFTLGQTSLASGLVSDGNEVFIGGSVGSNAAIVGLREDGTLNPAFGAAGIFTASTGPLQTTAELVGNTTLGLFLGATVSGGTHTEGVLVGATGAGARIPNFGTNGVVSSPLQTADQITMAPAITGLTGKGILVAGRPDALSPNSAVVLVRTDGSLTSKFGSMPLDTIVNDCPGPNKDGCVPTALAASADTTGFAHCAPRNDGTIVSARNLDDNPLYPDLGYIYTSLIADTCNSIVVTKGFVYLAGASSSFPTIQRYGGSGASDAWTTDALAAEGLNLQYAASIVAQADGTFAVAATASNKPAFVACRLTSSGAVDTTFAPPVGCSYQPVPSLVGIRATAIDRENRIVMVGSVVVSNTDRTIVATRFWQ